MYGSGKTREPRERRAFNEKNPFMLADVDRMVVGENAGLECKTAFKHALKNCRNLLEHFSRKCREIEFLCPV